MKCPKCKTINQQGATECDSCGVIFADIRGGRGHKQPEIIRPCPWNDHGDICGLIGSLSDSTNGSGPWYCAKHFWKLKGWPESHSPDTAPPSYREQWYADRNLPYLPPQVGNPETFAPKRNREPGDDDDLITQA